MKASTLFLGFTLVVLAAALAGLWQAFGPRSAPKPAAARPPAAEAPVQPRPQLDRGQARAQPDPAPAPADQDESGVRSVYPGARPSAARPPVPTAESPAPPPFAPPPQTAPTPSQQSAALRPPGLDAAPPAQPAPPIAPPAAPPAAEAAPGDAVDLNTAPVEALNNLGAGMIGKTIVANRPYAAPDDLVTRRILKRRDYETIRPRIVVR